MSLEITIDLNSDSANDELDKLEQRLKHVETNASDTLEMVSGIMSVSLGMLQALMNAAGASMDQLTEAVILSAGSVATFLASVAAAFAATTFGIAEAAKLAIATTVFMFQIFGILTQQNQVVGALAMGTAQLNMTLGMIKK